MAGIVVADFLPQALLGIVWGYLYMCTGNLWGPWAAHTLTNSTLNFLHVNTYDSLDQEVPARMVTFALVMLLGLIVIRWVSRALNLPAVRPWGGDGPNGPSSAEKPSGPSRPR